MKTKSFINQLNQTTKALLAMTPAQREVVHQSIQASQAEVNLPPAEPEAYLITPSKG